MLRREGGLAVPLIRSRLPSKAALRRAASPAHTQKQSERDRRRQHSRPRREICGGRDGKEPGRRYQHGLTTGAVAGEAAVDEGRLLLHGSPRLGWAISPRPVAPSLSLPRASPVGRRSSSRKRSAVRKETEKTPAPRWSGVLRSSCLVCPGLLLAGQLPRFAFVGAVGRGRAGVGWVLVSQARWQPRRCS